MTQAEAASSIPGVLPVVTGGPSKAAVGAAPPLQLQVKALEALLKGSQECRVSGWGNRVCV